MHTHAHTCTYMHTHAHTHFTDVIQDIETGEYPGLTEGVLHAVTRVLVRERKQEMFTYTYRGRCCENKN